MIIVTPMVTTIACPRRRMMNPVMPGSSSYRPRSSAADDYLVKYQSSGVMQPKRVGRVAAQLACRSRSHA